MREIRDQTEESTALAIMIGRFTEDLEEQDHSYRDKITAVKGTGIMAWPVATLTTYGCESWTLRNADRQRIEAYELKTYRRLLRVPWTAKRSTIGLTFGATLYTAYLH